MNRLFSIVVIGIFGMSLQETPTKKVSDYKSQLSDLQKWGKNLTDDKWYGERFKFVNNKGETKKFMDFETFDRRMFQMMTTQRFNVHLASLEGSWRNDLKKVAAAKIPDSADDPNAIAGSDDLQKMIDDLHKLRADAIASWETQAISIFKDYPKNFNEKDQEHYLKTIKELKKSLEI